ncbi:MAG: acyl-CoA dehydratase activase [Oscillospiraceae bacterium]|jgi:predicted CoA-substrate-specific enzyme activase|nr:acyl-CoA dehydratase activase [Oscillospiraceae bacterium]
MYRLGIDAGAAAVKLALLNPDNSLAATYERPHRGDVASALRELLEAVRREHPGAENCTMLACGMYAEAAAAYGVPVETEIEATAAGARLIHPAARSVVDIGSRGARYIYGFTDGVLRFALNETCAAGTGSFFESQMNRLGLPIERYSELVEAAASVPRIAGYCGVFSKTDITHLQQEGVPTADILLGLCYAAMRNFKTTVVGRLDIARPVLLAGGAARNSGVVRAARDVLGLADAELLCSELSPFITAIGAACLIEASPQIENGEWRVENDIGRRNHPASCGGTPPKEGNYLAPLSTFANSQLSILNSDAKRPLHALAAFDPGIPYYLGVDIGSTTTKLVLADGENNIADYQYLRTLGDPITAIANGIAALLSKYGDALKIRAVGVTGSGRVLIGRLLGADAVKDEITAQAACATAFTPDADTIFEIGGQDAKYIRLKNGRVADFQMNKICAAGTGSFVEEQALLLDIPLSEYGELALSATHPASLGERCTVFMESEIATELARGVSKRDIAAGICCSIVNNYLSKVVGTKAIGQKILLQGGVAYNPGIVAAFRAKFGERLTVAPYFSVSGAIGAAILAREEAAAAATPQLRGLASLLSGVSAGMPAPASPAVSGIESGELRVENDGVVVPRNSPFSTLNSQFERCAAHSSPFSTLNSQFGTIGIPRAMVNASLFDVFRTFFETLGYTVIGTEGDSAEIVERSQTYATAEVCFPLKLAIGAVSELVERGARYIFMPQTFSLSGCRTKTTSSHACVYMQKAPLIISECLRLKEKGVAVIAPRLWIDSGYMQVIKALIDEGVSLGHKRGECRKAIWRGLMAMMANSKRYLAERNQLSGKSIGKLTDDEYGFVVIARGYAIEDAALSLRIRERLAEAGHHVYDISHLNSHRVLMDADYPNLYWPFGRMILAAAQSIRRNPKLYAIYLTYHGCGPDGMLAHLFDSEMRGKPYLAIEVDEHASDVGVLTRLEAFVNSVKSARADKSASDGAGASGGIEGLSENIEGLTKTDPVAIPFLYPYSAIAAAHLRGRGYCVVELPSTTADTLEAGRMKQRGKEYYSFAALLGDVAAYAQTTPRPQVLLLQSGGSETDGQYARTLRAVMDDAGIGGAIVAPRLRDLLNNPRYRDTLLRILLAGDILLCAPAEKREALLAAMSEAFAAGAPGDAALIEWAEHVGDTSLPPSQKGVPRSGGGCTTLLLLGEPGCLYNGLFLGELTPVLSAQGCEVQFAPMSEAALFEWAEQTNEPVAETEALLSAVAAALKQRSPFSESVAVLRGKADEVIGTYIGGLGRYRAAKQCCTTASVVVAAASLYENTATVLKLFEARSPPLLALNFNGTLSETDKLRLSSLIRHI